MEELQRSLGRVEAKLDMLLETASSHEKRLSSVEKVQAVAKYAAGLVGAVIAFVANAAVGYLTK